MKRVARIILLVDTLVSSLLMLFFSARTGKEKFLAPVFLIIMLGSLFFYALLDVNPYESTYDTKEKLIEEYRKDREQELSNLLTEIDNLQKNLHTAVEEKNLEEIENSEKSLRKSLLSLLLFLENYSNYGKTFHEHSKKKNS